MTQVQSHGNGSKIEYLIFSYANTKSLSKSFIVFLNEPFSQDDIFWSEKTA
jgi:hypothetical protein